MAQTAFTLVIFGATGDLAQNKLIPALFSMYKKEELPEEFYIIGFARRPFTNEEFGALFGQHGKEWEAFAKHLSYQQGNFDEEWGYKALKEKLQQNTIFYL